MNKREIMKEVCEEAVDILARVIDELVTTCDASNSEILIRAIIQRVVADIRALPNKLAPITYCVSCGHQKGDPRCNCESSHYVTLDQFPEHGLTDVVCLRCEQPLKKHTCGQEDELVAECPLFQPRNREGVVGLYYSDADIGD